MLSALEIKKQLFMKKSLIVCHIANVDYPLFRDWLGQYKWWFDEIIIYWDIAFRFPILSAFMQQSLSYIPNIKFLDPVERQLGVDDWRDKATNEMLKHVTGDWIISLEQDFVSKNWSKFFTNAESMMQVSDMFGFLNMTNSPYIHPACFFIKRDLLEKTSKDFSPHPETNGSDHFAMITQDAKALGAKVLPMDSLNFEVKPEADAIHIGGINQAYLSGLNDPNHQFHRGEIFMAYNYWSMKADVEQSPLFMDMMQKMDRKLRNIYLA